MEKPTIVKEIICCTDCKRYFGISPFYVTCIENLDNSAGTLDSLFVNCPLRNNNIKLQLECKK